MNIAFLLTGGNIGKREEFLAKAKNLIHVNCGEVINSSALYETAAWGKTDQAAFLNQALEIQTRLNASELIQCILEVEKEMGRVRSEKYGARVIDIDIIFFNHDIIRSEALKIPHPQMQNRRFVLMPLAEIAPGFIHPVLKKTVTDLLAECPDLLPVEKQI